MSVMKVVDLFSIFKVPISEQVREYYRILFDADSYADLLSVDGDQCVPIIRNVAKRLRGYDIDIEEPYKGLLLQMGMVMAQTKPLRRPAILTTRPGLGKTEILISTLIEKTRMYSDYTALVVTRRVDDAIRIRDDVNKELGQDVCFIRPTFTLFTINDSECLNGHVKKDYHYSICSDGNCKQKSCEAKGRYWSYRSHKIFILTTTYFNRMLDDGKLDVLREYKDKNTGTTILRKELYIDENPGMVFYPEITNKILNHCKVHLLKNQFKQIHIDEFSAIMGTIASQMGGAEQYEYTDQIDSSQKLSVEFKQAWRSRPHKDYYELPEMINAFLENGGIRQNGDKIYDYAIGSNRYRKISGEGLRTVILDGTGIKDLTYKPEDFSILDLPEIRDFSRGKLHHYSKTISKAFLKNPKTREERITAIAKEAIECIGSKKALFITFKDSAKHFIKRFEAVSNIEVNYFGNLIGRNDYYDCSVVLFAGTNDWGEMKYLNQLDAVTAGNIGLGVKSPPPRFTNPDVREFYFTLLSVGIYQDLMRSNLRIASSLDEVDLYLWTHNKEIVQKVMEWLPGIQYKDHSVPRILRGPGHPKTILTEAKILLDDLKNSMSLADYNIKSKLRYIKLAEHLDRVPEQIELEYVWSDKAFGHYRRDVNNYLKKYL